MPNRDGTGPDGEGPRTGRGVGDCDETIPTKKPFRRLRRRQRN